MIQQHDQASVRTLLLAKIADRDTNAAATRMPSLRLAYQAQAEVLREVLAELPHAYAACIGCRIRP